jgi:hypothetical protein
MHGHMNIKFSQALFGSGKCVYIIQIILHCLADHFDSLLQEEHIA